MTSCWSYETNLDIQHLARPSMHTWFTPIVKRMEMQNVMTAQYITPRQKPVRIIRNHGLVSPAYNGRIAYRLKPKIDHFAATMKKLAQLPAGIHEQMDKGRKLLGTMSTPKHIRTIFIALGTLLLAVAIAAVGALERKADLHQFMLPEDGMTTTFLLDTLITLPPETIEEELMPALPVTLSLSSYQVAKNETLDAISKKFGIRLDTLISVNGIVDVRRIQSGTALKIPNIDGVAYKVKKGENLSLIAAARNVSMLDIVDANDLTNQTITPGQTLFIPGARLSTYDLKKALGKLIIWPIKGHISSYFGYRANPFTGIRQFHNGLDIAGPMNTSVKAVMDGRVSETGFSSVFGNFVILSHEEGYQTLYAHLNKILVQQGTSVLQGKTIGLLGTTGYSTGPHVHLGVFKRGTAVDPLKFLNGK